MKSFSVNFNWNIVKKITIAPEIEWKNNFIELNL